MTSKTIINGTYDERSYDERSGSGGRAEQDWDTRSSPFGTAFAAQWIGQATETPRTLATAAQLRCQAYDAGCRLENRAHGSRLRIAA